MARIKDNQQDKEEKSMDNAYITLVDATTRLSRIHAQAPQTIEDIKGLIIDMKECRSAVDAFFSASKAYLHCSNSANSDNENIDESNILRILQERQDKMDREGVMLWNRSSSLRHLLSDKSFDIEADDRSSNNITVPSPSRLIAEIRFTAVRLIHAGNPEVLAKAISRAHKASHHRAGNDITPSSMKNAIRLLDLYSKTIQELTNCSCFEEAEEAVKHASVLADSIQYTDFNSEDGGGDPQDPPNSTSSLILYNLACSEMVGALAIVSLQVKLMRVQLYKHGNYASSTHKLETAIELLVTKETTWHDTESVVAALYHRSSQLLLQTPVSTVETTTSTKKKLLKGGKPFRGSKTEPVATTRGLEQISAWMDQALQLLDREGVNDAHASFAVCARRVEWRIKLWQILSTAYLYILVTGVPKLMTLLATKAQTYLTTSPPNLVKAEKAIDELLILEPSFKAYRHKFRLLIRRGADDQALDTAFQACLETMSCTISDVSAIIKEIYQLPANRLNDIRKVLVALIKSLLMRDGDGSHTCVYLPVIAYTLGLTHSDSDAAAFESLLLLFDGQRHEHLILSQEAAGHLWKLGDTHLSNGDYLSAARWFCFTTHRVFSSLAGVNTARANRKIALCLLRADRLQDARDLIESTSNPTASDHYVRFLCAAIGDLEGEAIACMQDMVASPDFQLDMLLWATKQAQQYFMRGVYRACIAKLMELAVCGTVYDSVSCLALLRALLKETIDEQLNDQTSDIMRSQHAVNAQLKAAIDIISTSKAVPEQQEETGIPDLLCHVTWFYQTSMSLALKHLLEESEEANILADLASQLAEIYADLASTEKSGGERAIGRALVNVAVLRLVPTLLRLQNRESDNNDIVSTLQELDTFLTQAHDEDLNFPIPLQTSAIIGKFGLLCASAKWPECIALLDELAHWPHSIPLPLFQRLAQTACCDLKAPSALTTRALEIVVEQVSASEGLDVATLTKLLRAIIASTLDRGDTQSAHKHFQSALVLLGRIGDDFPRIELEWICGVCWNVGMDAAEYDTSQAIEWCDMAIRFGRQLPGYGETLDLMLSRLQRLQEDENSRNKDGLKGRLVFTSDSL